MAKKQDNQNPFEKLTFEQAIEMLGGIVQKIETGQVPLEESLRQYEQGMGLIGHCRKILLDAEKRIELIDQQQPSSAAPQAADEPDDDDQESENTETDDDKESNDDDSLF